MDSSAQFLSAPCWCPSPDGLERWPDDDDDGLWVRRTVAVDLEDAARLTLDWLISLVQESASARRSRSVHAWVWDASNEDPTWAWADQVDAVEAVAELAPVAPRITIRRWATADAILLGVVLDPPEPPCTLSGHVWDHSGGGGYRQARCATCGLRRERMRVTCDAECDLDFDEVEYVRGS